MGNQSNVADVGSLNLFHHQLHSCADEVRGGHIVEKFNIIFGEFVRFQMKFSRPSF